MKNIEWADATWNSVRGCSRVSAGCRHCYAERIAARFSGEGNPWHGFAYLKYPAIGPENVWLGVSIEDQATADERIPILLETPAAVRFVSAEPLLGPVDLDGRLPIWRCLHCGDAHEFSSGRWRRDVRDGLPVFAHSHGQAGHIDAVKYDGLDWVIVGAESGPGARSMDLDWARDIVSQCRLAEVPVFVKQLCERGKAIPFEAWPEDLKVREFPR